MVYTTPVYSQPVEKTWKPVVAGILGIIGGIYVGFLFTRWTVNLVVMVKDLVVDFQPVPNLIYLFVILALVGSIGISSILFAFTSLAFAGGVFSLKRRSWGLALAGSIIIFISPAILRFHWMLVEYQQSINPFSWIVVMILGATAIIFTAMSKKAFE